MIGCCDDDDDGGGGAFLGSITTNVDTTFLPLVDLPLIKGSLNHLLNFQ
jgi:hypothetical protein